LKKIPSKIDGRYLQKWVETPISGLRKSFLMIFVTGKSVTGDDCISFRGDDSVADEFLRYESKPGYRVNTHSVITFGPFKNLKKYSKRWGFIKIPNYLSGRKEILHLLRKSSKIRIYSLLLHS